MKEEQRRPLPGLRLRGRDQDRLLSIHFVLFFIFVHLIITSIGKDLSRQPNAALGVFQTHGRLLIIDGRLEKYAQRERESGKSVCGTKRLDREIDTELQQTQSCL